MAGDERTSRRRKAGAQPEEVPQTPPPQLADWSWLLQTLMGLQKTVGEVSQSVQTLTRQGNKHEEKLDQFGHRLDQFSHRLDQISHRLAQINHRIYAAVVVLTVVGAVLLWVLNAASDEIVAVAKEALLRSGE